MDRFYRFRSRSISAAQAPRQPQDFVLSGLTPDDHRRMLDWPDNWRFFEHLRDLPGPLRLRDLHGLVRSLGYSPDVLPPSTFQGARQCIIRACKAAISFSVGRKTDGGSRARMKRSWCRSRRQAATAIANARAFRNEQRARADLEALVDISPVGVAVFDAKAGKAVSFNREVNRILGGLLFHRWHCHHGPSFSIRVPSALFGDDHGIIESSVSRLRGPPPQRAEGTHQPM